MEKRHLNFDPEKMGKKTEIKDRQKQIYFSTSTYINQEDDENEEFTSLKARKGKNSNDKPDKEGMPSDFYL
jgi:hypothetical protein